MQRPHVLGKLTPRPFAAPVIWCSRQKMVVFRFFLLLLFFGVWSVQLIPLDVHLLEDKSYTEEERNLIRRHVQEEPDPFSGYAENPYSERQSPLWFPSTHNRANNNYGNGNNVNNNNNNNNNNNDNNNADRSVNEGPGNDGLQFHTNGYKWFGNRGGDNGHVSNDKNGNGNNDSNNSNDNSQNGNHHSIDNNHVGFKDIGDNYVHRNRDGHDNNSDNDKNSNINSSDNDIPNKNTDNNKNTSQISSAEVLTSDMIKNGDKTKKNVDDHNNNNIDTNNNNHNNNNDDDKNNNDDNNSRNNNNNKDSNNNDSNNDTDGNNHDSRSFDKGDNEGNNNGESAGENDEGGNKQDNDREKFKDIEGNYVHKNRDGHNEPYIHRNRNNDYGSRPYYHRNRHDGDNGPYIHRNRGNMRGNYIHRNRNNGDNMAAQYAHKGRSDGDDGNGMEHYRKGHKNYGGDEGDDNHRFHDDGEDDRKRYDEDTPNHHNDRNHNHDGEGMKYYNDRDNMNHHKEGDDSNHHEDGDNAHNHNGDWPNHHDRDNMNHHDDGDNPNHRNDGDNMNHRDEGDKPGKEDGERYMKGKGGNDKMNMDKDYNIKEPHIFPIGMWKGKQGENKDSKEEGDGAGQKALNPMGMGLGQFDKNPLRDNWDRDHRDQKKKPMEMHHGDKKHHVHPHHSGHSHSHLSKVHFKKDNVLDSESEKSKDMDPILPSVGKTCKVKVDVGFILDSSGSLRKDYLKEKFFLKALAEKFDIGDTARAGVVTFSKRAKHSIKMKDHMDIKSFKAAVDDIPLMGSYTRIDRALRLAQKELFEPENGARSDARKILIVLTDGAQTAINGAEDPGDVSDELRGDKVTTIVIGVGAGVDLSELDEMAGGKGKAYRAKSFNELISGDFIDNLTAEACKVAKQPAPPPPPPKAPTTPSPPLGGSSSSSSGGSSSSSSASTSGSAAEIQGKLDVGFLVDASGSISLRSQFHEEKHFVKLLAGKFDISVMGAHAGVVTFSAHAEHNIRMKDYMDVSSFNSGVDNITFIGSEHGHVDTRIDIGLQMCQKELYKPSNGARVGSRKILVMLLCGDQTPKGSGALVPADLAQEMREDEFIIIVIGIGDGLDAAELDKIAGGKGKAFKVKTFDKLNDDDFINIITQDIKAAVLAPPSTPVPPTKEPKCKAKVDVGFIVDSSGSLKSEYQKEKDFVKALAEKFDVSEDGSHVGVIAFSARAEHSIKMNEHTDHEGFNEAVDNIPLMGSYTRIDRALRLAQKELFSISNGARASTRKVLILLTDGAQTPSKNAEDPGSIVEELRKKGVETIVIGIGRGVEDEELDKMAGGKGKAVHAKSFNELISGEFLKNLTEEACKAALKATPPPSTPASPSKGSPKPSPPAPSSPRPSSSPTKGATSPSPPTPPPSQPAHAAPPPPPPPPTPQMDSSPPPPPPPPPAYPAPPPPAPPPPPPPPLDGGQQNQVCRDKKDSCEKYKSFCKPLVVILQGQCDETCGFCERRKRYIDEPPSEDKKFVNMKDVTPHKKQHKKHKKQERASKRSCWSHAITPQAVPGGVNSDDECSTKNVVATNDFDGDKRTMADGPAPLVAPPLHRRHHRRHKPYFSSKRDRDSPSAPEELMRSLNFPKRIYPGEQDFPGPIDVDAASGDAAPTSVDTSLFEPVDVGPYVQPIANTASLSRNNVPSKASDMNTEQTREDHNHTKRLFPLGGDGMPSMPMVFPLIGTNQFKGIKGRGETFKEQENSNEQGNGDEKNRDDHGTRDEEKEAIRARDSKLQSQIDRIKSSKDSDLDNRIDKIKASKENDSEEGKEGKEAQVEAKEGLKEEHERLKEEKEKTNESMEGKKERKEYTGHNENNAKHPKEESKETNEKETSSQGSKTKETNEKAKEGGNGVSTTTNEKETSSQGSKTKETKEKTTEGNEVSTEKESQVKYTNDEPKDTKDKESSSQGTNTNSNEKSSNSNDLQVIDSAAPKVEETKEKENDKTNSTEDVTKGINFQALTSSEFEAIKENKTNDKPSDMGDTKKLDKEDKKSSSKEDNVDNKKVEKDSKDSGKEEKEENIKTTKNNSDDKKIADSKDNGKGEKEENIKTAKNNNDDKNNADNSNQNREDKGKKDISLKNFGDKENPDRKKESSDNQEKVYSDRQKNDGADTKKHDAEDKKYDEDSKTESVEGKKGSKEVGRESSNISDDKSTRNNNREEDKDPKGKGTNVKEYGDKHDPEKQSEDGNDRKETSGDQKKDYHDENDQKYKEDKNSHGKNEDDREKENEDGDKAKKSYRDDKEEQKGTSSDSDEDKKRYTNENEERNGSKSNTSKRNERRKYHRADDDHSPRYSDDDYDDGKQYREKDDSPRHYDDDNDYDKNYHNDRENDHGRHLHDDNEEEHEKNYHGKKYNDEDDKHYHSDDDHEHEKDYHPRKDRDHEKHYHDDSEGDREKDYHPGKHENHEKNHYYKDDEDSGKDKHYFKDDDDNGKDKHYFKDNDDNGKDHEKKHYFKDDEDSGKGHDYDEYPKHRKYDDYNDDTNDNDKHSRKHHHADDKDWEKEKEKYDDQQDREHSSHHHKHKHDYDDDGNKYDSEACKRSLSRSFDECDYERHKEDIGKIRRRPLGEVDEDDWRGKKRKTLIRHEEDDKMANEDRMKALVHHEHAKEDRNDEDDGKDRKKTSVRHEHRKEDEPDDDDDHPMLSWKANKGDDTDKEDKDEIEKHIETKAKEIQEETKRRFKDGAKNRRVIDKVKDDDVKDIEEDEKKYEEKNKKRSKSHKRYKTFKAKIEKGNYRKKDFHAMEFHGDIEKFGRGNDEIEIHDHTRGVDQLQAEIDRRLEEGSNSLPPQSQDEKDKLQAFDDSFITSPEEESAGEGASRGKTKPSRQSYGPDEENEGVGHGKTEPIRQSYPPEDEEEEEEEEQRRRLLTNLDDYDRKEVMGRKSVQWGRGGKDPNDKEKEEEVEDEEEIHKDRNEDDELKEKITQELEEQKNAQKGIYHVAKNQDRKYHDNEDVEDGFEENGGPPHTKRRHSEDEEKDEEGGGGKGIDWNQGVEIKRAKMSTRSIRSSTYGKRHVGKRKPRKVKRQELFLAPHRRNLLKSVSNVTQRYVEAMDQNTFIVSKAHIITHATDNVKTDPPVAADKTSSNNDTVNSTARSATNTSSDSQKQPNLEELQKNATIPTTNNDTIANTTMNTTNIIKSSSIENATASNKTAETSPLTSLSHGNSTSSASSQGQMTASNVTTSRGYKRHELVFQRFFSKPGFSNKRIVRTYKLFSRR